MLSVKRKLNEKKAKTTRAKPFVASAMLFAERVIILMINCVEDKCRQINMMKKEVVEVAYEAQEGHIASALSILDILWVMYDRVLDIKKIKENDEDRDRFILSKGHASLGLYVVLYQKGLISKEVFYSFCKANSPLGGHPDRNKIEAIEASTGSLGHGFPMAVGMALGIKIMEKDQRIYVLVGDGELNEGAIWETAMVAAHHKLDNIVCIVDYNHSTDRALDLGNISKKFEAFGWDTEEVDGHDYEQLSFALKSKSKRPLAIVANTIKGKGISFMENNPEWHHKFPNNDELKCIFKELS